MTPIDAETTAGPAETDGSGRGLRSFGSALLGDRRAGLRLAATLVAFAAVVAMLVAVLVHKDLTIERKTAAVEEQRALSLGRDEIAGGLQGVFADLTLLAALFERTMASAGTEAERLGRVSHTFRQFADSKMRYGQVRFIDVGGHERVRVDYAADEGARIVATDRLQSKRDRYYFRDSIALPRGRVFVSPLDLNMEGGALERPLKPMIRFATPVFREDGERAGIVIVNHLARLLLDAFEARLAGGPRHGMVLNRDGFWLRGPSRDLEWGFMLGTGEGFHTRHPEEWRRIAASDRGQFRSPIGLVTYDTFYPLAANASSSTGAAEAFGPSDDVLLREEYFWKTVTVLPRSHLVEREADIVGRWLLIGGPVWYVGSVAIYWLTAFRVQRQQAVEARALSEERFRDFADSASDWLWEMGPDLRFTWFSGSFRTTTGHDTAEFVGRTREEIGMPDADADLWRAHLDDLANHRPFKNFEYRLRTGRGSRFYFRVSGIPIHGEDGTFRGYRGTGSNITDIRLAEEAARRQADLSRTIVETVPHFVFWKDRDLVYVGCNRAFARVAGVDRPEDIVGKTDFDLAWKREEAESFRRVDAEVMARGEPQLNIEEPQLQADGTEATLLTSKVPMRDADGNVVGVVGIFADITDLKRTETLLRQSQKLRALGDLAAGISHELNNLLLPILMLTEATMKALTEGSEEWENLREVATASRRAGDLVRQIGDFSRIDEARASRIDLNESVARGLALPHATLPASITLVQRLARHRLPVDADADQLAVALANLVSNAADAMAGATGTMTISTEATDVDADTAVAVRGLAPGRFAVLRIADTGHGMDADTLGRVYDPFFTTKEVGQGSGLGLSVVEGIVKRHGGGIDIDSAPERGATVSLYLPLADDEPETAPEPQPDALCAAPVS